MVIAITEERVKEIHLEDWPVAPVTRKRTLEEMVNIECQILEIIGSFGADNSSCIMAYGATAKRIAEKYFSEVTE